MMAVKGGCVFSDDGDGCLSAKYVNENSAPYGEICKLKEGTAGKVFEGIYDTVWLENTTNSPVPGILKIKALAGGSYDLEWSNPTRLMYRGVGMLYHDYLVCGYWST